MMISQTRERLSFLCPQDGYATTAEVGLSLQLGVAAGSNNPDDSPGLSKVLQESMNSVPPADQEFTKWWPTNDTDIVIHPESKSSGLSSSF
jgi:hypothetical protein